LILPAAISDIIRSGFASNAGLKFNTPEEFFLGQVPGQANGVFNPKSYLEMDLKEPRA
jgi:bifunctional polynucleotide phosphatase/kinase